MAWLLTANGSLSHDFCELACSKVLLVCLWGCNSLDSCKELLGCAVVLDPCCPSVACRLLWEAGFKVHTLLQRA